MRFVGYRHRGVRATLGVLLGFAVLLPLTGCGTAAVTADGWPLASTVMVQTKGFSDTERLDAYLTENVTTTVRTRNGVVPIGTAIDDMVFVGDGVRIVLGVDDDANGRQAADELRKAVLAWPGDFRDLEVWSEDGSLLAKARR